MNHAKHKSLSVLLICVLALTALAGCSQDTSGGSGMATPPSSTETTEQTQGGTTAPSDTPQSSEDVDFKTFTIHSAKGDIYMIDIPTVFQPEEIQTSSGSETVIKLTDPYDGAWTAEARVGVSSKSDADPGDYAAYYETYIVPNYDPHEITIDGKQGHIWHNLIGNNGGVKTYSVAISFPHLGNDANPDAFGLINIFMTDENADAMTVYMKPQWQTMINSIRAPE